MKPNVFKQPAMFGHFSTLRWVLPVVFMLNVSGVTAELLLMSMWFPRWLQQCWLISSARHLLFPRPRKPVTWLSSIKMESLLASALLKNESLFFVVHGTSTATPALVCIKDYRFRVKLLAVWTIVPDFTGASTSAKSALILANLSQTFWVASTELLTVLSTTQGLYTFIFFENWLSTLFTSVTSTSLENGSAFFATYCTPTEAFSMSFQETVSSLLTASFYKRMLLVRSLHQVAGYLCILGNATLVSLSHSIAVRAISDSVRTRCNPISDTLYYQYWCFLSQKPQLLWVQMIESPASFFLSTQSSTTLSILLWWDQFLVILSWLIDGRILLVMVILTFANLSWTADCT